MASICQAWDIPYLNLADIHHPTEIQSKLSDLEPKIILTSIEDISNPAIQSELQTLDICYIAVDEAQVSWNKPTLGCTEKYFFVISIDKLSSNLNRDLHYNHRETHPIQK